MLIVLHLPHDLHARPLQAQIQATHAAEQRAYAHSHALHAGLLSSGGAGREGQHSARSLARLAPVVQVDRDHHLMHHVPLLRVGLAVALAG